MSHHPFTQKSFKPLLITYSIKPFLFNATLSLSLFFPMPSTYSINCLSSKLALFTALMVLLFFLPGIPFPSVHTFCNPLNLKNGSNISNLYSYRALYLCHSTNPCYALNECLWFISHELWEISCLVHFCITPDWTMLPLTEWLTSNGRHCLYPLIFLSFQHYKVIHDNWFSLGIFILIPWSKFFHF